MADCLLDVGDDLAGIRLVPAPIEVFRDKPELNDEIIGEILRLDLATFLSPQPQKGCLVIAHDDAGIRAANEVAVLQTSCSTQYICVHLYAPGDRTDGGFRLKTLNFGAD